MDNIHSIVLILYADHPSESNTTMDQRIVLAGLAAGVGLAAGAFLAVSFAKSQAAKAAKIEAAKIERRRSETDPVPPSADQYFRSHSIALLDRVATFDYAFISRSHIGLCFQNT